MAPMATSRKMKRKLERAEKKQSKFKRQRKHNEDDRKSPKASASAQSSSSDRSGHQHRQAPRQSTRNKSKANGIQNRFHELLQETALENGETEASIKAEEKAIKSLESKLGLAGSSKDTAYKRLKSEYAKDGFGDDFADFLADLDTISKVVSEAKQKHGQSEGKRTREKTRFDEESEQEESEVEDDDEEEKLTEDEDAMSDFEIGSDMEMDEATRREFEMLQQEDAEFLQGMEDLPTDVSESESDDVDLAEFDTEDDDEEDDDDDQVKQNTAANQKAAMIDDVVDKQATGKTRVGAHKTARFEDLGSKGNDDPEFEGQENVESSSDDDQENDERSSHKQEDGSNDGNEGGKEDDVVIEEDIYGRPVLKNANGKKVNTAYIPPHLRRKMQEQLNGGSGSKAPSHGMDEQALRELTRRINGQLNRISESNMESIALEMERIYREHPRSVVNEVLFERICQTCLHERQVMTPLIKVCAALVAALYHLVGTEVGGFFAEKLVLQLIDSVKTAAAAESAASEIEEETTSRKPVNLMLLVSMLYNFGVVQCMLIYDLFRSLVNGFSGIEIELIHQLLKSCGIQLRSDDSDALREMVTSVQQRVNQAGDAQKERVRFILDLIYDLKKPSKNKKNRLSGTEIDLTPLKKWLGRVKSRSGNSNNALRLSLNELLHAEQNGRWWIVGGTWVGYQQAKTGEGRGGINENEEDTSPQQEADNRLLKLAEKQRMNTDVRKKIFVAIMGASDCIDAYERLLQLHLKEKQEREIVRVLIHCCGQEKKFNKYYQLLGEKICEMDVKFKFTFQLAFWDVFKQLETFKPRKLYNLASMLSGMIASSALSLSCLKVLDFTNLNEQSVLFLRVVFEKILKLENETEVGQIFHRLLQTKKAQLTIDGIAVFFHQHLSSFRAEEDLHTRQLMKKRSKMVRSVLDQLSKTAATKAAMEDFQ